MGYRIENKPVDLSGLQKLKFAPSAKAGDTYRYRNSALRIFRDGEKTMDQETAEYLTGISTERILLPRKLLFYNNAFKGYTMKLVSHKGSGKKMLTTPKRDLLDCVEALENDVETISQKKVLLNGTSPNYTLYNGELYLVNPVNYSVLELSSFEELERLNRFQLHLLLTELIAGEMRRTNYSQALINRVREILKLRDMDESSSSYLKEVMKGQETVKEFVKKIS